jgi:hypothetical protein
MLISFITTIKICKNYEFLVDRINIYILNVQHYCKKYDIPYEILICEQVNEKNIMLIKDKLQNTENVSLIELIQTYDNPLSFNLIESYGKNACLTQAKGTYTCMTSADQMFSEDFFIFIKNSLKTGVFYRFATYEVPAINIDNVLLDNDVESLLSYCSNSDKRLCNPGCFDSQVNSIKLGQKSGDIMLLDTESFRYIKGWPETICFTHMDCAVCMVATNNFPHFIPDKNICSYTFSQSTRYTGEKIINVNGNNISIENFQWQIALTYLNKKTCN